MKIEYCFLGMIALGALAPSVSRGESALTDPAKIGTQGTTHRNEQSKQQGGDVPAQQGGYPSPSPASNGASNSPSNVPPRTASATSSAGTPAAAVASSTAGVQSGVGSRRIPNAGRPHTPSAVAGNSVAPNARGVAVAGGSTAPRQRQGGVSSPAANGTLNPSISAPGRSVANQPNLAAQASTVAARTPSQKGARAPLAQIASALNPASMVSGNVVARHTSVKSSTGGSATQAPLRGALVVIGGTAMRRKL
jgi:hypothetical protein